MPLPDLFVSESQESYKTLFCTHSYRTRRSPEDCIPASSACPAATSYNAWPACPHKTPFHSSLLHSSTLRSEQVIRGSDHSVRSVSSR